MAKFKYAKLNKENLYVILDWNEDKIIQYTSKKEIAEKTTKALNEAEETFNLFADNEVPFA